MYIHVVKCDFSTHGDQHPRMSKTKVLNVRIDPELKKKAKKLAEADGRSLSNWVTKLISSKVKEAEQQQGKEGRSQV